MSGSFFWAEQPDPLPPPVGAPAALPTPDVPSGDFVAAAKPGSTPDQQSDKESYLHIDLSGLAAGAKLSALKLTLKEDAAGANVNSSAAVVTAHPVTEFFADGATGSPYSQRPKYDTSASAKGTRGADGTWTFDLGSLAQGKDATTFFGVALVPTPAAPTDGWEVVWSGKDAAATYSAGGAEAAPAASGSFLTPPAATSGSPTGSGASSGSSSSSASPASSSGSSGGSSSSFSGSTSGGSSDTGGIAASTGSAPVTATTPSAGSGQGATPAAKKAAGSKHGLPWVFIPAAIAVLLLLGGAAVALGRAGEPVPPREGSVVRRLERPADAPA